MEVSGFSLPAVVIILYPEKHNSFSFLSRRFVGLLTMKTLLSRAALAAVAAAAGLSGAHATQATGSLTVSLTVTSTCTVGASSITFARTTGQQDADGTGSVSISCGAGTPYTVGLGPGSHASGTTRMMATSDGSFAVEYELYSDPAHTIIWNNSAIVRNTSAGVDSIPVYGHAKASGVPAGVYTDTVSITVSY